MKILKNIVLAVIVLLVVLAVAGLAFIPAKNSVTRSTVIQAPADVIFDQVNDLKKNEAWSPWKDSTMKLTYGAVTSGLGATSSWTSKHMGNGTMTIEETVPYSSLKINLDFGAMGTSKALWSFIPEGDGVKVTEVMAGDAGLNPAKRWMSLMSDKMVGPYFEKGLASLKQVSETRAAELKVEEEAIKKAAADSAAASIAAAPAAPAAKTAPAAHAAKAK